MTSQPGPSTCAKIPYPDHASAQKAIRGINRNPQTHAKRRGRSRKTLAAYRCDACDQWHLGNYAVRSF